MEEKNRCLYDPFGKDTLSQLEIYPEFQFQIKNKDKFISYLILVYDMNSEFFIREPDNLYHRKRQVAEKVGFKLNEEGHFDKYVEEVLVGENESFNLAVLRYSRFPGIPDLPVLIRNIELLDYELSSKLPADPTKRAKVRENIKQLRTDIEELEIRIFSGKESEKARESLYKFIETMRVPRPEFIAKATADKSLEIHNPYHND